MLAASAPPSLLLYLLFPALTFAATIGLLYTAFYPQLRDRRAGVETRRQRDERIDATADAVLGRVADPRRGRAEIRGLVHVVPEQARELRKISYTLGSVNGNGKTVMTIIHEAADAIAKVAAGQVESAQRLEGHIHSDNERFVAVDARVSDLRATVTQAIEERK